MCKLWYKNIEDNSSPFIKKVRIVLLVMIIVGVGLLGTQSFWVPRLVAFILK